MKLGDKIEIDFHHSKQICDLTVSDNEPKTRVTRKKTFRRGQKFIIEKIGWGIICAWSQKAAS
jgi:hypothetical protein